MRASSSIALIAATAVIALSCSAGLEPPDQLGKPPADSSATVPSQLDVSVTVAGPRIDPDGYLVVVAGAAQPDRYARVGVAGGDVHFVDLAPGTHTVRLTSVAAGCSVGGDNPRPSTTAAGETATVHFAVDCVAPVDSVPSDSVQTDSAQTDSTPPSPWTAMAPLPEPRGFMAVTTLNGIIYVAGGLIPGSEGWLSTSSTILAYDPAQNVWRSVGELLEPVVNPAIAATNDRIYVFGGCPGGWENPTAAVQIFDPATGAVELGPPMPLAKCEATAVVLDGVIHVLGGAYPWGGIDWFDGDTTDSRHDVLDPATNAWSTRASLPIPHRGEGAMVLDGKIYVAGGTANAMQVYDPSADSWMGYAMPPGRSRGATAGLGRRMYLLGGSGCCGSASSTVERIDPITLHWELSAPLTGEREGLGAAVVGESLYVIGGIGSSGVLAIVERFTPND